MRNAVLLATDPDAISMLAEALLELLTTFWYIWALLALLPLGDCALRIRRAFRLRRAGIAAIDVMDGPTFERYLVSLFGRLGYAATHTGRRGDFGADLVVEKDGGRMAVQAKRSSRPVGVAAVQEASAATAMYECSSALVVTNAHFSRAARHLAEANGVALWDRGVLVQKIVAADGRVAAAEPARDVSRRCAACGDVVSNRVRTYCLARPARFGGRVYCYGHQRALPA